MSDIVDIATENIENMTSARIAARVRFEGTSRSRCLECDEKIPLRRRQLLPGVELCVDCQRVEERRKWK